jgi:uncharacterized protein involved in tellurium resistance
VLTEREPVVTLTRLQSGVGVLTVEAACSPAIGDLRLGCAYDLASGHSSVVQYASGVSTAPARSSRPVIIGSRGQYERLVVDLVQIRTVERLVVYAYSESGTELRWGGTLVLTTFGGARIEVPLDRPPSSGVLVVASLYNIDGELVIRAELTDVAGTVRDAVGAFGFDRIGWVDPRTPVV